jgi:large subunit ribosomal protein L30e
MDVNRALRKAIDTGKVKIGARETTRALKGKKVKLVIVASNCRVNHKQEFAKYPNVPQYKYEGNNMELGSACGKPFPVSSIAVIETGESNIMELVERR